MMDADANHALLMLVADPYQSVRQRAELKKKKINMATF